MDKLTEALIISSLTNYKKNDSKVSISPTTQISETHEHVINMPENETAVEDGRRFVVDYQRDQFGFLVRRLFPSEAIQ